MGITNVVTALPGKRLSDRFGGGEGLWIQRECGSSLWFLRYVDTGDAGQRTEFFNHFGSCRRTVQTQAPVADSTRQAAERFGTSFRQTDARQVGIGELIGARRSELLYQACGQGARAANRDLLPKNRTHR